MTKTNLAEKNPTPSNTSPEPGLSVVKNEKLRIALLGYRSHPYCGGQGIYLRYLSKALVDLGHSVDVISGPPYPQLDERVRLIEMPSMDVYSKNRYLAWFDKKIFDKTNLIEYLGVMAGTFPEPYTFGLRAHRYLEQHRDDYDIVHDNQSLCYGLLDIEKLGLPVVATIHHPITVDLDIALKTARNAWQRILIKHWFSFLKMQGAVARRLNNIITVSEAAKTDIAKGFGCAEDGMEVIYNGVDTDVFKPMPSVKRQTNRIIVTASADAPLKGLDHLLEAFALLRINNHELQLVVVGSLKKTGHTARLIRRLDIEDYIENITGVPVEEIVRQYAMATIAVSPSLYEGFGLPAAEAMSCGVPIVSTTGGALPEVVGDAGLVVPPSDSVALAEAIQSLLNDPEQRETLSRKGRERVLTIFAWDTVAETVANHYYRAIDHANT